LDTCSLALGSGLGTARVNLDLIERLHYFWRLIIWSEPA